MKVKNPILSFFRIISLFMLFQTIFSKDLNKFWKINDHEQEENKEPKLVEYVSRVYPLKKSGFEIGQIGGLSMEENGYLMVFHRAKRTWSYSSFLPGNVFNTYLYGPIKDDVLCLIDTETKEKIDSWGANRFYMPHGITVDFEGNVWLTDVGSHQVFKYNFEKNSEKPLLVIGEKLVSGNDKSHFCKPTSVAVSKKTREIFVADGYCNSRIAQFDQSGRYIKSFEDSDRPIQIAHSILLIDDLDLTCTASREDGRIICFDIGSGKISHVLTDSNMKTVYAIKYDEKNKVIQALTGENNESESFGLTFDASKNNFGKLIGKWDADDYDLADTHDLALSDDGSKIYIGQLNGEIDELAYNQ